MPKPRRLQPSADVISPFYRKADLMALFGVTEKSIEKWVASGQLPEPIRQGRGWVRWPKKVIDQLIQDWAGGVA
jgi:predicted DNA-binding transcriptional regulator AlpA